MPDLLRSIPKGPNNESLWDWQLEFAKGLMSGYRRREVLAVSDNMKPSDGIQVIGDEDGDLIYPFEPKICTVVSTSADDSESNTGPNLGARRIRVTGINPDGDLVTDLIFMNGITPVNTTTEFVRVVDMRATLVSVDREVAPAGTVTVTHPGDAETPAGILNKMRPNYNRQNFAIWHTQRFHKYFMRQVVFSVAKADEFQIQVQTRQLDGSGWLTRGIMMLYEGIIQIDTINWLGLVLPGRDIRIVCEKTNSGAGTISAFMEFLQVESGTGV